MHLVFSAFKEVELSNISRTGRDGTGRVIQVTYFKIFVGVLHPNMHCLEVTILHDTKHHAPVMVIWRKRELSVLKRTLIASD